jgi:hypothetical protein
VKKFRKTEKTDLYLSRNFTEPEIQIFCNQEFSRSEKNRLKPLKKFLDAKKMDKTIKEKFTAGFKRYFNL